MEHRNAGTYALIGSLALASGFTIGFVAGGPDGPGACAPDGGCDGVAVTEAPVDAGDPAGTGACLVQEVGDDGDISIQGMDGGMTIRIVIDDRRDGDSGPTDAGARANEDEHGAKASSQDGEGSHPEEIRVAPRPPVKLTASQRDSLSKAVRRRLGDDAVISFFSCGPWDGGKGNRLDLVGYADGDGFSSRKELAEAFGKLMAELVEISGEELDGIELMSVRMFGVDDIQGGAISRGVPTADEADWIAQANVDIPSRDGKSVGDVNRATIVYGGKTRDLDLTGNGFSDLPPEE